MNRSSPGRAPASASAHPASVHSAPAVSAPGAPGRLTLPEFAAAAMPSLETDGFHAAYYRVLDAFASGLVRRLIVTVPPQHGKSTGSSVLLPAYVLGLDPELSVAVASYSASLAQRFGRRVQRLMDSAAYASLFPRTVIKGAGRPQGYTRSAELAEIIGTSGSLTCVGREGSLTGSRIDLVVIDDLYKDALEAGSPAVRENCWEWYTSVVRTRMHNLSRELVVFTRWHEEDLIGRIRSREPVSELTRWAQLGSTPPETWLYLNFEALKESPPTEIDPRPAGEPLWPSRHSAELLCAKRRLDSLRFECMYQGRPSCAEGLLYGDRFRTYTALPDEIDRWGCYTDTADTGEDYLCSVAYAVDRAGDIYVTDVVYSQERMEVTEQLVAAMLRRRPECTPVVESNNGGRGFARAVQRLVPEVRVGWFHQSAGKEARIVSNAAAVLRHTVMPLDWHERWSLFARHLTGYLRRYRANRFHDAPDALTGIVERECSDPSESRILAIKFSDR